MQKALAEAQLAQLQGQLRPHFLFNALNTVSALMHTDVARADRLVATLGDLLRISLRSNESRMWPFSMFTCRHCQGSKWRRSSIH
jgi:LytS/YehU family sensor histidine kinase